MVGQAAMMGVMEDIAELTYTHGLTTFVRSPSLQMISAENGLMVGNKRPRNKCTYQPPLSIFRYINQTSPRILIHIHIRHFPPHPRNWETVRDGR